MQISYRNEHQRPPFGRSFCFRVSAVVDEAGALKTVKALGIAAPSFVHRRADRIKMVIAAVHASLHRTNRTNWVGLMMSVPGVSRKSRLEAVRTVVDPFRKSATFEEISIAAPKCLPTVTLPPLIFEGGAMVEGSSIGFQLLSESVE
jgi:hypothetical protein